VQFTIIPTPFILFSKNITEQTMDAHALIAPNRILNITQYRTILSGLYHVFTTLWVISEIIFSDVMFTAGLHLKNDWLVADKYC
jgi:hypothetical protein